MNRLLNAPPDFYLGCTFTICLLIFAWRQYRWMRNNRIASAKRLNAKMRQMYPMWTEEQLKARGYLCDEV